MKNTLAKIIVQYEGKELSASTHGRKLSEEIYDILHKHDRINDSKFIERFIATLKSEAAGIDVKDYENAYKIADSIIEVLKNQNVKNLKEIDLDKLTPQPKKVTNLAPPSPLEMIGEKPIKEPKVEATVIETKEEIDDNSISELTSPKTKNVNKNVNKINKPKPDTRKRRKINNKHKKNSNKFFNGGNQGNK